MSRRLYFTPQHHKGQAINPYCDNYINSLRDYYTLIGDTYRHLPRGVEFFIHSWKADVYILNWIESISQLRGGFVQACFCVIALCVIRLRRKKIVWMFHNIHPLYGETISSRILRMLLFKWASLIVSHSEEAAKYARRFARGRVAFRVHPMMRVERDNWAGQLRDCDFFCWGTIQPYKGIAEFLTNPKCRESQRKILILGKCDDEELRECIETNINSNIVFENRRATFPEIAAQCKRAKYVLFPYVGEGVSSSGVLMDTLLMGGVPVGPNRGAFADLSTEGCCITYNAIDEVFNLPMDEEYRIKLDQEKVDHFIDVNSWASFGKWLYGVLENNVSFNA